MDRCWLILSLHRCVLINVQFLCVFSALNINLFSFSSVHSVYPWIIKHLSSSVYIFSFKAFCLNYILYGCLFRALADLFFPPFIVP